MIRVYAPAFTVLLTRLVNRTGGQAATNTQPFKQIDITPYLGSAGVVRTIKDIHQPAGGFSLTFSDKEVKDFGDTLYALCEPMDLVEIRGSRTPEKYVGAPLPLIMRGFVSSVDRAESMTQDGTPQRTVTISGQDMGKLWLINHVYFELAVVTENDYLTTFHLQAATGIQVANLPVSDFMRELVNQIINPKIAKLSVFADAQVAPFVVDASVPDGLVLPQLVMGLDQVAIWQIADTFADRPYNEMFIQDREDGPHFIFRPAPYKSLRDSSFIMHGAVDPGTIEVDISDVVAVTVSRSDARVGNFFWCPPGVSQLDTNAHIQTAALMAGYPLDFGYDNNKPELFGVRKMTAGSNLYPQSVTTPVNMMPPGSQSKGLGDITSWMQARGAQLMALNRDNSGFEEGGAVLKGSEDVVVGKYLRLIRGTVRSEQYITQVSHSMSPLQTWTTSVHFIRGNGFVERNKRADFPYEAEGRKGPYSK